MNETPMSSNAATPAADKLAPGNRLNELLTILRQTTSELHSELRECLASESRRQLIRPSQGHLRRNQQLDKAHELFRQAEARLELLVYHFGNSSTPLA
jgi:hypothetical protein